ncbi:hypothetical protein ACFFJ4_18735 [Xanthomonas dyei]|uniref:hypothetical protein n=1 Tax=Xanthomonas dyei TaxID=743699 RepID=UPI001304C1E5|nr:hypothetical protein [Xanthomonas dyei]
MHFKTSLPTQRQNESAKLLVKSQVPTAKVYTEKVLDESSRKKIRDANRPHASVPFDLI